MLLLLMMSALAGAPSGSGRTGETGTLVDTGMGWQDADGDGSPANEDCDDADPLVYPIVYGFDGDEDDYGTLAGSQVLCGTAPPPGFVSNIDDCDDNDNDIFPGAVDIPDNGVDEDCDGADTVTIESGDTGVNDTGRPPKDTSEPLDTDEPEPMGTDPNGPKLWFCGCGTSGGASWLGVLALLPVVLRRRAGHP